MTHAQFSIPHPRHSADWVQQCTNPRSVLERCARACIYTKHRVVHGNVQITASVIERDGQSGGGRAEEEG